jgi:hypothetical protein
MCDKQQIAGDVWQEFLECGCSAVPDILKVFAVRRFLDRVSPKVAETWVIPILRKLVKHVFFCATFSARSLKAALAASLRGGLENASSARSSVSLARPSAELTA